MTIRPLRFKECASPALYACDRIATTDADGQRVDLLVTLTGKTRASVLGKALLAIVKYRLNNNLYI